MNNAQKAEKIVNHILEKYSPTTFHLAQGGVVLQSQRRGFDSIRVSDPELRVEVIAQLRDRVWEVDGGMARTLCV